MQHTSTKSTLFFAILTPTPAFMHSFVIFKICGNFMGIFTLTIDHLKTVKALFISYLQKIECRKNQQKFP